MTEQSAERNSLLRGSMLSFGGSIVGVGMGFLLTIALTRTLGDSGSGIVLQVFSVFTIALSVARLGMDSAAVWIVPRLVVSDRPALRSVIIFEAAIAVIAGVVCAVALIIGGHVAAGSAGPNTAAVGDLIGRIAWLVPFASALWVCQSAVRSLGSLRTYVLVNGVALPTVRLILVGGIAVAGGSLTAVTFGWALPQLPALAVVAVVVMILVRRLNHDTDRGAIPRWPDRSTRRSITRYALPRTLSTVLEQSLISLDVILVGALAGSAAAGVYGGASRFVAAGLVVDAAVRTAVSPRFSQLIHLGELKELESSYRSAACWLVLLSSPIYTMIGIFAPAVLGILGPDFSSGESALLILCIGAIITTMAGNIQSVLLMSGHSGWSAANKAVVLAVNVLANLILVPWVGIVGAAISWAACMLLDAMLAVVQVRKLFKISVRLRSAGYALLVGVLSFAVPGLLIRFLWAPSVAAAVVAGLIGMIIFGLWCRVDRHRLALDELGQVMKRRS